MDNLLKLMSDNPLQTKPLDAKWHTEPLNDLSDLKVGDTLQGKLSGDSYVKVVFDER